MNDHQFHIKANALLAAALVAALLAFPRTGARAQAHPAPAAPAPEATPAAGGAPDPAAPYVEFTSRRRAVDVAAVGVADPVWEGIAPQAQPLIKQFLIPPKPETLAVYEVEVRSIHDGKSIAFRLSWADATRDDGISVTAHSDACALQFPVKGKALPQYFMGQPGLPVHILHWKAWRSRDVAEGRQGVRTAYPNMTVDMYNFDYPEKHPLTDKTDAEKDVFLPARAAKNPVALGIKGTVEELVAEGYGGTMVAKPAERTYGESLWKDGRWTVLLRRPLAVDDPKSAAFAPGETIQIAFAVWEGSRRESGARKAVSPAWAEIALEK